MKVTVTVTVDIDPAAWADEYGTDRSDVRADVKRHVQTMVDQQLDMVGVLA